MRSPKGKAKRRRKTDHLAEVAVRYTNLNPIPPPFSPWIVEDWEVDSLRKIKAKKKGRSHNLEFPFVGRYLHRKR